MNLSLCSFFIDFDVKHSDFIELNFEVGLERV
jgi:hypothetical protein